MGCSNLSVDFGAAAILVSMGWVLIFVGFVAPGWGKSVGLWMVCTNGPCQTISDIIGPEGSRMAMFQIVRALFTTGTILLTLTIAESICLVFVEKHRQKAVYFGLGLASLFGAVCVGTAVILYGVSFIGILGISYCVEASGVGAVLIFPGTFYYFKAMCKADVEETNA